jgi:hypothetical protein
MMPPKKKTGSGSVFLAVLVLTTLIGLAFFVYKKIKDSKAQEEERIEDAAIVQSGVQQLQNGLDKTEQAMTDEAAGFDQDDVDFTQEVIQEEAQSGLCVLPPDENGNCQQGMIASGDCCELASGIDPTEEKLKMAQELGSILALNMAFDYLILDPIKNKIAARYAAKLATKAGQEAGEAGAKKTAMAVFSKLGKKVATEAGEKAGIKVATKAALKTAKKAAVKGATKLASKAVLLAGGPVGVAILLAEVLLMVLDIVDPSGYGTFKSSTSFLDRRKLLDYQAQMAAKPDQYPMFFGGATLWPRVFEIAVQEVNEDNMIIASDQIQQDDAAMDEVAEFFANDDLEGGLNRLLEITNERVEQIVEGNLKGNDMKIFDKMKAKLAELSTDFAQDLKYYDDMFEKHGTGIGVTGVGVGRWNNRWKPYWDRGELLDTFMGLYTRSYFVLDTEDPGTAEEPNMKLVTLNNAIPILAPYAPIYKDCEGTIKVANGPNIHPKDHGVTFDWNNGVCNYTSSFCDRYVMASTRRTDDASGLKYDDCKLLPGQGVAEMILGETLVRGWIKVNGAFTKAFSFDRKPVECTIPQQMDVEGKCTSDADCKDGQKCAEESGFETGMCASENLVRQVGTYCNTIQSRNMMCPLGLQCNPLLTTGAAPGEGYCIYPFNSDTGDIPYAVCLGSREMFNYTPHRTRLQESARGGYDLVVQTKCMKKSRFDDSDLGKKVHCPEGYIDIAYDRSNCALGARRAFCAKEDEKDRDGTGYKVFKQDEVEIKSV